MSDPGPGRPKGGPLLPAAGSHRRTFSGSPLRAIRPVNATRPPANAPAAFFALSLVSLILAAAGCRRASPVDAGRRGAGPLQEVTVAYTTQPQCTLLHVAAAQDLFAGEGLAVRPLMHTYGKAALQSLLDGKADLATAAETPIMFSQLRGEKILVFANIEATTMNNAIVARLDSGISGPGDLKGKRIGFTPGTTSDFFLASILTTVGLGRQDVESVGMRPEEMAQAILERKVDAVSTWNYPLTQIKRQLGPNATVIYDRDIYTETFNLVSDRRFVREHPETVESFLRALIKAETFVAAHREEAQAIVSAATKTDRDLVREVWSNMSYRVELDETLLIALEDETRWAMRNGLTDRTSMPDYRRAIHLDSLVAVKPEAVRVHR